MIAPEHVGTYRQQAAKMVIQRTGGAPIESKRPVNADGMFLDGESPTLVTLDETCEIDVPFALKVGALVRVDVAAPAPTVPEVAGEEASNG